VKHPFRWTAVVAVLLVAAAVLASFVPFVWPSHDRIGRYDAVIVLSGDRGERLDRALELVSRHPSAVLVLDGSPDIPRAAALCQEHPGFAVVCLRPDADSTRNEARAAAKLAEERGWWHVVVVTSTPHVTRSRLLFRRCVKGSVVGVAAWPPYGGENWIRAIGHEWLGTADALMVDRGC